MRPTAGTGNGVHSVSAGFGRVYVDLGKEKFTPELWLKRLNEGRSFVTTGPLLTWSADQADTRPRMLSFSISAQYPLKVEVIRNGEVMQSSDFVVTSPEAATKGGVQLNDDESGWFAIRCFEKLPSGRLRFAHSAPVFVDVPSKPLRPPRDQVRYLIQRCKEEIARNKDVLNDAELAEYREALEFYQSQLATAR
jgi:hypothetical protein